MSESAPAQWQDIVLAILDQHHVLIQDLLTYTLQMCIIRNLLCERVHNILIFEELTSNNLFIPNSTLVEEGFVSVERIRHPTIVLPYRG